MTGIQSSLSIIMCLSDCVLQNNARGIFTLLSSTRFCSPYSAHLKDGIRELKDQGAELDAHD